MGIKVVLNLMTKQEIENRGINWQKLNRHYNQRGIEVLHHPLDDQDYNIEEKLFEIS